MGRLHRFLSWGSPEMTENVEQPASMGDSPRSRDDLIEVLAQALSERKVLCDLGTANQIKSSRADFSSEAFSLCILGVGCMILVKAAYSEYRAFQIMKSQGGSNTQCSDLGHSVTMGEFIKYRVDFYFSSNPLAKPMLLLGLTFIIIMISSIFRLITLGETVSDSIWRSWTYVADPGTHAESEGSARIIGFLTTVAGMLVFALMIGVVSDSIGARVDDLKKGTAKVVESNHTLILGWSEKGIALVQQIALANQSEGGLPIVVLCSENKEEMESTINSATQRKDDKLQLHGSRVIFRNGNPMNEHDLNQVSAAQARSIIVLSQGGIPPDDADSRTVRQILTLQQIKANLGYLKGHIVVELQDIDNLAMTKLVGKDDIEVIVSHELIGRLMLLAARSPWIAPVLASIMGFEGAEFYFKEWPELVGARFGSICYRFDDAVPVGIKRGGRVGDGQILINPSDDEVILEGDLILVLAEDDDSYSLNDVVDVPAPPPHVMVEDRAVQRANQPPEKMLFCGWRRDMADMINELDYDVQAGSELWLFNNVPMHDRELKLLDKGNKAPLKLKNLKIRHAVGNPASRRQLLCLQEVSDGTHESEDGFKIGELTGRRVVLSYFSSILILSDSTKGDIERDVEASDSRSLATTLGIQDIQQASMLRMAALGKKVHLFPPISEILDIRTANQMLLISQGYVMSNHLVASYLAMVSEDRSVNRIYGELLSCRGAEIQIHRIADYIKIGPGETLSFWDVFRIARGFKDLVIGYIKQQGDHDKELRRGLRLDSKQEHAKVLLNPEDKRTPRLWHPEDRLILISLCRRAKMKAEMKAQRAKAEEDLRQTILSGADVAIHGWIKKLGKGHHRTIDMDDERSWRDRLAFVVDETMYYVSEKRRGEKEVVCKLDNIWHVEVGNGWPPGHFTFKIYLAPEDRDVERNSFSLESLPSRVFSAPTLEDCKNWITVLSRGGEFGEERDRCNDSPRATRHGGPGGGGGIVTIGDMLSSTQPKNPSSPVRLSVDVGSRRSLEAAPRMSIEGGTHCSVSRSSDFSGVVAQRCGQEDVLLSGGEEKESSSSGEAEEYIEDPHPSDETMWKVGGQ